MLQSLHTYRWCWASLLITLFLLPQLQQQMHRYEASAHLEAQWHCESGEGQFHLHDTEHYGAHHCDWCQVVFQVYPLLDGDNHSFPGLLVLDDTACQTQPFSFSTSVLSPPGRAPPALL